MVLPARVICPLRKSTRRQKAAVCVVNVGVLNRYIYPIRYGDASVFTHIPVRVTAAEHSRSWSSNRGARQADSASNANAPTIPAEACSLRQQGRCERLKRTVSPWICSLHSCKALSDLRGTDTLL